MCVLCVYTHIRKRREFICLDLILIWGGQLLLRNNETFINSHLLSSFEIHSKRLESSVAMAWCVDLSTPSPFKNQPKNEATKQSLRESDEQSCSWEGTTRGCEGVQCRSKVLVWSCVASLLGLSYLLWSDHMSWRHFQLWDSEMLLFLGFLSAGH